MRQTFALIVVILAGFGLSYALDRSEREGSAYRLCSVQRDGRVQGNIRAEHQKLLESAIILSNEKAQKEIPGYSYPSQIKELREAPPIETLPPITC